MSRRPPKLQLVEAVPPAIVGAHTGMSICPAKSPSRRWLLRGLRFTALLSGLVLLIAPGSPDRVGALSLIAIALAHPDAWR